MACADDGVFLEKFVSVCFRLVEAFSSLRLACGRSSHDLISMA